MRSLFVFNPVDLNSAPLGGVQRCTRQFMDIVAAASDFSAEFKVGYDTTFSARFKRRSRLFPYTSYDPLSYANALRAAIDSQAIDAVFLNRAELMGFANVVATISSTVRVVVMSHGNSSGDLLYEIGVNRALKHGNLACRAYDYLWLGGELAAETRARHTAPFTVCVMSKEEEVLERWLGSRHTLVLPRAVEIATVDWTPHCRRVGWIGSLHHTPNIVALDQVLSRLAALPEHVCVEIIGYPATVGERLARTHDFVTYKGALTDAELPEIVKNWSLFINPIFWLSKGASMKLADALGWGLPVLTTSAGRRGYELPKGCVAESTDDPDAFVAQLSRLVVDTSGLESLRARVLDSAMEMPSATKLGARLRAYMTMTSGAPRIALSNEMESTRAAFSSVDGLPT